MSNLSLQHLENQFLTLRQQSQNLVNLQDTAHMNQQGPVHTIHSQHVVQPSPTSVQNHWIQPPVLSLFQQSVPAPPPYMFRQPGRTQLAPSQNIIPNSHMQAQHSQMIYPRAAVATQLSPFDSNNSIAVTPSTHLHSQIHHMSSTQGQVQINTSSNKIVPELITKSYVSNDMSNSSIGDSKNSFAVNPSTHLHSQIHHMPPLLKERQYKDTQDELFKNFCKDNQIVLPSNYPIDHTYHQGDSKSQIDYILTKPRENDDESTEYMQVKILREGHNTSDHYPVSAEFYVRLQTTQKQQSGDIVTKINWEKVDKTSYEQNLKEELKDRKYLNMRTP
ncbi:Hypothetical predicted protein [Mytilus galloprovincialis]|uniref:Endonuclease/exonuclease/phosphatase domain-containing protein n=1 Tax=Mytilus galloprovincialis TaxID=29158 RepID=A0A8B6EKB9_MYTGA|nr:Hypothetical predicted protein [Mytilus galloprovincialis]